VWLLHPNEVVAAARFLEQASFADLWERNRAAVLASSGGSAGAELQTELKSYATSLTSFYAGAARSSDAVMKWIAF
jgi:hypothetical protein